MALVRTNQTTATEDVPSWIRDGTVIQTALGRRRVDPAERSIVSLHNRVEERDSGIKNVNIPAR